MIVRYFASEWCMTSLFQKGKIYGMWRFSLSFTVSSCTTKPLSSQFWLDNAEENVAYLVLVQWWGDDRQVSQSGKPLCTGASLWAVPKLARGLCPLEPRHVNDVSISAKCPPDIPTEHLLIDQDAVLHLPKRNIAFPLMEFPANLPAGKVMADL